MKLFILAWALALAVTVQAHPDYPLRVLHGLTSDQHQSTFDNLVALGYRLNYVSAYTSNNDPRFATIWEKRPSPSWISLSGMTSVAYQQNSDRLFTQGYRVAVVNGYTVNGVDYYVAVWEKSPLERIWVARHGLTASEFQTAFDTYVGDGMRLKHVSGYAVGKEARYAAIWEQTDDGIAWVARFGMTDANLQTIFDTYVSQGYRLVLVQGYEVDGVVYYAAIWDKSPSEPWVARSGLSFSEYMTESDIYARQGYMPKLLNGYGLGQGDRYAAIWEAASWFRIDEFDCFCRPPIDQTSSGGSVRFRYEDIEVLRRDHVLDNLMSKERNYLPAEELS